VRIEDMAIGREHFLHSCVAETISSGKSQLIRSPIDHAPLQMMHLKSAKPFAIH